MSKKPGETSKRLERISSKVKIRYRLCNGRANHRISLPVDKRICQLIERVCQLAEKHNISITEILRDWLLTRVTASVVGVIKRRHIERAVKAVSLKLPPEELTFLEELYVQHRLVGMMVQI